jgi:A/G-specific adenine glycosylase
MPRATVQSTKKRKPAGKLPVLKPHGVIASNLVTWFSKNRRPMPWRETRDAYRIWISEIMLQQTQVATVIPYYERFVARFPAVAELAAAPLDDVLKLWSGLGYYSRARNLHRGAQLIVERFAGKIPQIPDEIREIPGIGPYTAGAILSIAYGKPEPIVDGNVARVLSRLFLLKGDYRKPPAKEVVWDVARELARAGGTIPVLKISSNVSGDLNQALMELGATVCTPRAPECLKCPLAKVCKACANGVQEQYPELEQKSASPVWHLRAWVVEDSAGRMLFAQRAPDGLFGGLWEVPTEKLSSADMGIPRESRCAAVTHVLTHRVLEIDLHITAANSAEAAKRWSNPADFPCWSGSYTQYCWLSAREALKGEAIGLSSIQKKILREVITQKKSPQLF